MVWTTPFRWSSVHFIIRFGTRSEDVGAQMVGESIEAATSPGNNQIEWGSGLYIAYGGGIFSDGFESGDTTLWSASVP